LIGRPKRFPSPERLVALSRTPIFVRLLGAVSGLAGRIADPMPLGHELEERRVSASTSRQFHGSHSRLVAATTGSSDGPLEDCVADKTPFALLCTARRFFDAWRTEDPAIDELLLRLGDGVR